jgi:predicted transcriptional regulator
MPEPLTRDRIVEAIRALPPDATIDDAIERLLFLAKIEAGLKELDEGKDISHDEIKRQFRL